MTKKQYVMLLLVFALGIALSHIASGSEIEAAMTYLNAYRAKLGRPAIVWQEKYESGAKSHAGAMAKTRSLWHSSRRLAPGEVCHVHGTIGDGQDGVRAIKSWLASKKGHREAILSWTEIAIARSGNYWCGQGSRSITSEREVGMSSQEEERLNTPSKTSLSNRKATSKVRAVQRLFRSLFN